MAVDEIVEKVLIELSRQQREHLARRERELEQGSLR